MTRPILPVLVVGVLMVPATAIAQAERRGFAAVLVGVSALSADSAAVTDVPAAEVSLYKPESGIALNVLAGMHLSRYFSIQANYIWNRNDLTLVSSFLGPTASGFYQQERQSAQHAVVGDVLIYFRPLGSALRPYLGTGACIVRFASRDILHSVASNLDPPAGDITAIKVALRSHVGIDFALSDHVMFRYSFSETISGNPISPVLMPEGARGLMNFQNLFGMLVRF